MLIENSLSGSEVTYAIVGIGINVTLNPAANPLTAPTATALNAECGEAVSRAELLRNLLEELDGLYCDLMAGETPLEEWRGLLDTLGKQVTVQDVTHSGGPGSSYRGFAEDVDDKGNLLLRMADGRLVALAGGEVTMQEPPEYVFIKPLGA